MSKDRVRMIIKFDKKEVADIFKQVWVQSLPSLVPNMNEAVNKQGIACDLHVEQTKSDEFTFRHKSGNKGIVFVPSDDAIGVKFIDWDDVPLRTKYMMQTPQGFVLLIKTGDIDQKLEFLSAKGFDDLRDSLDEYEERIVEEKIKALEAEKKAKEGDGKAIIDEGLTEAPVEAVPDPNLVEADGSAKMEVNTDEDEGDVDPDAVDPDQDDTPEEKD